MKSQFVLLLFITSIVTNYVFQVSDIPYTISGKKVEKAVLHAILGKSIKNKDALINPDSLKEFSNLTF